MTLHHVLHAALPPYNRPGFVCVRMTAEHTGQDLGRATVKPEADKEARFRAAFGMGWIEKIMSDLWHRDEPRSDQSSILTISSGRKVTNA